VQEVPVDKAHAHGRRGHGSVPAARHQWRRC